MELLEALKTINENMESQEVKDFLQPIKDQHFSKSLETWKQKTLPGIIKESIEQPPAETPEQIRLKEMAAEIEKIKTEKEQAEFVSYGISKGLNESVSKALFINGNPEQSRLNIDDLAGQIKQLKEFKNIQDANGQAPKGGSNMQTFNLERIGELTPDQIYDNLTTLTK